MSSQLYFVLLSLSCSIICHRSEYKLNFSIRSMSNSQLFKNHHGSHALFSFISLDSKCIPYVFNLYYPVYQTYMVINCEGDQKKLFSLIHSLFGSKKITVLSEYTSSFTLASSINMFFIEKIHNIKMEFPLLEACLPAYSFVDIDTLMPVCTAVFDTFQPLSCDVLASIIHKLNRTTCDFPSGQLLRADPRQKTR